VAKTALDLTDRVQTTLSEIDAAEQEFQKQYGSGDSEDSAVYKAILTDFQVEQTTLCREYQQIVAEKEAEIIKLKNTLADGAGAGALSEVKEEKDSGRGNEGSLILEVEQLKLEKDVLSDTAKAWEVKLRELLKEKTENTVEIKKLGMKLSKMEEREKARAKAAEIIVNSPTRESAKGKSPAKGLASPRSAEKATTEETIEGLVLEYTKLSAENQRNSDLHETAVMDFKTRCEEYETKIKAQEQNILLLMNKGEVAEAGDTAKGGTGANGTMLLDLQGKVGRLEKELAEAKAQAVNTKASRNEGLPPPPLSNLGNKEEVAGLRDEVMSLKEKLREQEGKFEVLKKEKEAAGEVTKVSGESKARELEQLKGKLEERDKAQERQLEGMQMQLKALKGEAEAKSSQMVEAHAREMSNLQVQMDEQLKKGEDSTAKLIEAHAKEVAALRLELESLGSNSESASAKLLKAHEEQVRGLEEGFKAKLGLVENDLKGERELALDQLRSELEGEKAKEIQRVQEEAEKRLRDSQESMRGEMKSIETRVVEAEKKGVEELERVNDSLAKEKDGALAEAAATLKSTTETLTKEKEEAVNAEKEEHAKTKSEYEKKLDWLTEKTKELVQQHQEEQQKLKDELSKIEGVCAERQRLALEEAAATAKREKDEAVEAMRLSLLDQVASANSERDECKDLYMKEAARRKAVHNKLIELQGNIRVIARVRPVVEAELASGEHREVIECTTNEDLVVHRDSTTRTRFEFDKVCDQGSSQAEAYELVSPLVTSVLDGYNVCIFAYGQTGSGKTYTMEGPEDNRGVNYQAITEMFSVSKEREEDVAYTFKVSMLEVYNNTVRDLLSPSVDEFNQPKVLQIRQAAEGNVVQGLTEIDVLNSGMVEDAMKRGSLNRSVGSHSMNLHSSRSHLIVTVRVAGVDKHNGVKSKGKLHLIDLAGSERISKTDAVGERLKEAQSINNSLSALGNVINALGKKKVEHVPYRDSKLTFLLQDSLGGNSKVMMFVNMSPVSYNMNESLCSLTFAARCRAVQLGNGKKNDDSQAREIKRLKNVMRKAGVEDPGRTKS